MKKLCKSISHCPCFLLAGKAQNSFYQLTLVDCFFHQRSKNLPNGWLGLRKGCRHRSACFWILAVWSSKSTLFCQSVLTHLMQLKQYVWFLLSKLIKLLVRSLCYHTVRTYLGSSIWAQIHNVCILASKNCVQYCLLGTVWPIGMKNMWSD